MNERERFLNWVSFREVDRPLRWEWAFRQDTTVKWREQGLPADVPEKTGWTAFFGLDRGAPFVSENAVHTQMDLNLGLLPLFDEKKIAEDRETVTWRNGWGTVARSSKMGASIPQYLSFGVRSRADFIEFKKRWDPANPERYPADWNERRVKWKGRDYPLRIHTHGWYGILRQLMGMEELSVAFYEQEALIEEMAEFWGDFLIRALDRASAETDVDFVLFWEDLAFKTSSLLSPEHFRRFFLPHYKRVITFLRKRGIRNFMVDSDGNIESIIPLWLEAGINILGPFEVAAGMDVVKTGREYPELIMVGGLDKQAIAVSRDSIEKELARRIPPLLERGGYVPALDHATIPEISLADYRYYRRRVHELHGI